MGLTIAFALAAICFAVLALVLRIPRQGWEAAGAALVLALAGFAFQASSDQPGAPKAAAQTAAGSGADLVDARRQLSADGRPVASNQWLVYADAFARNGQYGDAASLALTAAEKEPGNADTWLALANNLLAHGEGNLTPAAIYAYGRAAQADPAHPGPPFFLGLALAGSGKLAEGRTMWADLLARAPAEAPWRGELAARLERLDAFIAAQNGTPPQSGSVAAP